MQTRKSPSKKIGAAIDNVSPHIPAVKRRKLSLALKKVDSVDKNAKCDDTRPSSSASLLMESNKLVKHIDNKKELESNIKDTMKLEPVLIPSEGYYLSNFKFILDLVLNVSPECHVIPSEGIAIVEQFKELPQREEQLYVRLFLRKHQWLRTDKISYSDIAANLTPVINGLVQCGFIQNESQLTEPGEVLPLLQVSELKELRKQLNLPPLSGRGGQKTQIIESFFKHDREHKPLFGKSMFLASMVQRAKKRLESCVRVSPGPAEVFSKIMLLFSLTSDNQGEEDNTCSQIIYRLLQINVGALKYPDYETNVSRPLFPTPDSFHKYYEATKEEQALTEAIESKDSPSVYSSLEKFLIEFQSELQSLKSHAISTTSSTLSHTPPLESTSLPSFLLPFTICWFYARLLSKIVEYLDKAGDHERANVVLECLLSQNQVCMGSRGRWYERLALNCDYHLKKKEKSLQVIKRALSDSHVRPARRLSMIKRARRLIHYVKGKPVRKQARKKGGSKTQVEKTNEPLQFDLVDFPEMELISAPEITISGTILRTNLKPVYLMASTTTTTNSTPHTPTSSTTVTGPTPHTPTSSITVTSPSPHTPTSSTLSQPCTAMVGVERYAMHHYSASEGWLCGVHGEGSSFSTLFGLLMWELIFVGGILDVFRTPYQSAPLDLCSDWFYKNRKQMIDERLTWLRSATVEDIGGEVESCWSVNHGTVCAAVHWELFDSAADVKSLAMCMGGELLANVCEVFSKDFGHSIGGLPDLTLWNPVENTCKFVEVKGPGDKLSTKQLVWLSRLAKWGCSVEVCHVKGSLNKAID